MTVHASRSTAIVPRSPGGYGEPVRIDETTTVIPVSRRSLIGGAVPVGLFTINGSSTTWTPAVDTSTITLIGVLTGFVAATLGTAAVLRRPPWPQVTIRK